MKKVIFTLVSFAPALALAQTTDLSGLSTFVRNIGNVVNVIIPVIFAIAIVYFFWGLVQFLRSAGDPKTHADGKAHMIYAVIAIAVMVSIYGLVAWLQSTFGITSTAAPILPIIPLR